MEKYILDIIENPILKGKIKFDNLGIVSTNKLNTITFCERKDYLDEALRNENISTIMTTHTLYQSIKEYFSDKSFILIDNPKFSFWKLHNYLFDEKIFSLDVKHFRGKNVNIHPTAYVEEKTYIGNNVSIGANTVIQNGSIIDDNSVIHNNCTIGAEGLQSVSDGINKLFIRHIGGVKIGKNVHILSNSVVSKAVFDTFTEIGDNTSISILSSIGHNSKIGRNCNIAGNTIIGGSAIIGDNVWIGPSCTIKDSIKIGNNTSIKIGSVVVKDVKDNEEVSGNFAYNHTKRIRNFVKEQR